MRRDWKLARAAHMSRPCRWTGTGAYGQDSDLELAHLLGRKFDVIQRGPRGGKVAFVHPQSVVVLRGPATDTGTPHNLFDSGQLDLWPLLSPEEQMWCIDRVGVGEARRRVSGRAWLETAA